MTFKLSKYNDNKSLRTMYYKVMSWFCQATLSAFHSSEVQLRTEHRPLNVCCLPASSSSSSFIIFGTAEKCWNGRRERGLLLYVSCSWSNSVQLRHLVVRVGKEIYTNERRVNYYRKFKTKYRRKAGFIIVSTSWIHCQFINNPPFWIRCTLNRL